MSIIGWYYLHENGELIYKPSPDAIADIRDSSLAKCSWPIDPKNRQTAWDIVVESLALGANKERVKSLAEKWSCGDEDADFYAERVGASISVDGNQFCATALYFTNLQEHPAGFGDTKLEALADLANQLGLVGGHMWRSTFKYLLN